VPPTPRKPGALPVRVLSLTTYADYVPEAETENPLPEPVAAVPNMTSSTCSDRREVSDGI